MQDTGGKEPAPMEASPTVSSRVSLLLDLPPSCIQFCLAHPKFFVVGTYNLEKNEDDDTPLEKPLQSRNGSLVVFKLDDLDLTLVQTLPQPSAILDLRFHPRKQDVLAVISSTGTLAVFRLDPMKDPSSPLEHLRTSRCGDLDENVLFLQCNWYPAAQDVIGVTTSTGAARLLQLDEEYGITDSSLDIDIPNSLEAWSIAFSPQSPAGSGTSKPTDLVTAYCGGDDSMLRYISGGWDPSDQDSPYRASHSPITIKGIHTAGVTAILPLPLTVKDRGRVVVTGSYDDHIRVLLIQDLQESFGMRRVELIVEENLGGGVWRLDLIDIAEQGEASRIRILASCMHAGARIIEVEAIDYREWDMKILCRFEEHKSMNYGSDFVRPVQGDNLRCVSTSFYDKLLCVWEYEGAANAR